MVVYRSSALVEVFARAGDRDEDVRKSFCDNQNGANQNVQALVGTERPEKQHVGCPAFTPPHALRINRSSVLRRAASPLWRDGVAFPLGAAELGFHTDAIQTFGLAGAVGEGKADRLAAASVSGAIGGVFCHTTHSRAGFARLWNKTPMSVRIAQSPSGVFSISARSADSRNDARLRRRAEAVLLAAMSATTCIWRMKLQESQILRNESRDRSRYGWRPGGGRRSCATRAQRALRRRQLDCDRGCEPQPATALPLRSPLF